MAATTVIPPYQAAARARMERRITRLLRELHTLCGDVLHFRAVAVKAAADHKVLIEFHPEFAHASLSTVAVYWVFLALPIAVWLIDVCLLSAVSEYLASVIFPDRPQLVLAARLGIALAIVGFELAIAALLNHLYEQAEETENRALYMLCWAGALVWAGFLCACVVATQKAAGAENEDSTRMLMFALTASCFLVHLLLPASHRLLHDAKGYLLFRLREHGLRNKERAAGAHERAARQEATTTFQHYVRDVNQNNMPAGPFTVAARTVINEIFGENTLPPPAGAPAAQAARPTASAPPDSGSTAENPAPSPNPQTAHDAGTDAENDYLRTILTRRQSEDESEVRA